MSVSSQEMSWEVRLPGKDDMRSSWGARPKGVLVVESESHGRETIHLPLAVARSLAKGKESAEVAPSSRAELLYVVRQLSEAKAMERVAGLVDRRDYSSKEATDKLRRDGYSEAVAASAVSRALGSGLIDDRRFADVFVRSKVGAGWGMRRISSELRRRGIEVDDLPGWPYDYLDPDDERDRAVEVALRHRVTGQNRFQKMVRFLVGRGFSTSVAYDAARQALEGRCE